MNEELNLFLEEVEKIKEQNAEKKRIEENQKLLDAQQEREESLAGKTKEEERVEEIKSLMKKHKITVARNGVALDASQIDIDQVRKLAANNEAAEAANKYYAISFPTAILISIVSFSSLGVIKGILISVASFVIVLIGSFFMDKTPKQPKNSNSPHMECPHCKTVGQINTRKVDLTKGISGGKAVAGLITGGLSILAVGISREETKTEARCGKCNNVWHF